MRLERLSLRGFLRFRDPVTLDFRELPPGLIAIVGENGAGKTTLLEAAMATLHRQFPSRDHELVDYATERDSYLDLEFAIEGRGAYRARVNVDHVRRSSDAVLEQLQPDGRRLVLNDGKVSTYSDVIRQTFPSKELMLASSVATQNKRGNFIGKKPKERKELMAEVLGLQAYEAMATTAKTIAGFIDQARGRLKVLRDELARETGPEVLKVLEQFATELETKQRVAVRDQAALQQTVADLEARLAAVHDQVVAFAAASARVEALRTALTTRRTEREAMEEKRADAAETLADEQQRILAKRDATLRDLGSKIAGNERIQGMAEEIRAAVSAIAAINTELVAIDDQVRECHGTLKTARADLAAGERTLTALAAPARDLERARTDVELLATVPCEGAGDYAACRFLTNAQAAQRRIPALEQQLENQSGLETRVKELAMRVERLTSDVEIGENLASILRAKRDQHQTLAQYAEALAVSDERVRLLQAQQAQAHTDAEHLLADARCRHDNAMNECGAQQRALDATIARLVQDLERAVADQDAAAKGHQEAALIHMDLTRTRDGLTAAAMTLATIDARRTELDRRREEFSGKQRRRDDVALRLIALETELVDWQLLAKALGHSGLPDLEIDAAGPAISALTNELLGVCFGPRFSVELVTQVVKADGKGMRDEFTVKVTDNARGGETRDVGDLSGGEQVIVSEALMNAIALYVNTRSPMPIRTAWRDETTGALDPENAVRYVQMLRKVHELGGLHHTLFITHNPDVAAMADAQIRVADGAATIALQPYQEAA